MPAVLLDVDGTLLDTNHLHVIAWCRALRRFELDVPMVRIHGCIGMGGPELLQALLGDPERQDIADARQEEFKRLWPDVRVLPGAQDLVRVLHAGGAQVVLATSSSEEELDFYRSVLAVDECLAGATSSKDAEDAKPAPDILLAALDEVGEEASSAVMVGDTVWDMRAAMTAGIASVGLLSGGIARLDLVEAGSASTFSGADLLVENLDCSPIARLLAVGTTP